MNNVDIIEDLALVESIGERTHWPYVPGKWLTEPFVDASNNDVMPFFFNNRVSKNIFREGQ